VRDRTPDRQIRREPYAKHLGQSIGMVPSAGVRRAYHVPVGLLCGRFFSGAPLLFGSKPADERTKHNARVAKLWQAWQLVKEAVAI
jgi:hypothetical protein